MHYDHAHLGIGTGSRSEKACPRILRRAKEAEAIV